MQNWQVFFSCLANICNVECHKLFDFILLFSLKSLICLRIIYFVYVPDILFHLIWYLILFLWSLCWKEMTCFREFNHLLEIIFWYSSITSLVFFNSLSFCFLALTENLLTSLRKCFLSDFLLQGNLAGVARRNKP